MLRRGFMPAGLAALAGAAAGCSSRPVVSAMDFFRPARGVCTRSSNQFGAAPGCARAFREDQNYRPGLFSGFRRSNQPVTVPATVPEVP